jgi:hypothetical protein
MVCHSTVLYCKFYDSILEFSTLYEEISNMSKILHEDSNAFLH